MQRNPLEDPNDLHFAENYNLAKNGVRLVDPAYGEVSIEK